MTIAECTRGIGIAGRELQQVAFNGKIFVVPEDFAIPPKASATVHLLPNYDEYFIGFKDRSAIAHRLGTSALVTGGNALIANVVIAGGQLIGGWRRVSDHGMTVLRFDLRVNLPRRERASLERAVKRYADYAGKQVGISGIPPA